MKRFGFLYLLASIFFIFPMTITINAQTNTELCEPTIPAPLRPGDKIAIVSPSGPIDSLLVDSAARTLEQMGYVPMIYPHACGKNGHFSGTHAERLSDLSMALTDPDVRAILCARGGYGAAILLDSLATLPLEKDPKWIIGFSDISALHALMSSRNIASIHASMAKQLCKGIDDPYNKALFEILEGTMPEYEFCGSDYNHPGVAEGPVVGGNLAVLQALIGTPYDIIKPGTILFIEDVAEPLYKIERMIYQLRMMGAFSKISGLIVGQFTEYNPDDNHQSMEQMISEALADYPDLPVAFYFPVGHVDHNVPMPENWPARLEVTPETVRLIYKQPASLKSAD